MPPIHSQINKMQLLKDLSAAVIGIIIFNVIATSYFLPYYDNYNINKIIREITFIIDSIQIDLVQYYKSNGHFPNNINNNVIITQIYDIKTWHKENIASQFAVTQGMINSIELGLDTGQGGMITCLLVKKIFVFESKCFYQIKQA